MKYKIKRCAVQVPMALSSKKGKKTTFKIKPKTCQLELNYPYLSTKGYAFSTYAVYRKQRQVRETLQYAEGIIAKELGQAPVEMKRDRSKRMKLYIRGKQR